MQERWQNGVADQASGDAIDEASTQPLAVSFRTLLPFIRVVTGLLDPGPRSRACEEDWMGKIFVGHVELHPRGKWLGVRFIHNIHIRYESQHTLLFFSFELLGSNFLRGVTHSDCPLHSQDAKFNLG